MSRTITTAADLAALGNASVVPEDQGALVYARAFVQEVINDDAGDDPDPQWVYDRLVESLAVINNLTAALPFLTAAPSATRDEVAQWVLAASSVTITDSPYQKAEWLHIADALLARFTITPKEDR